MILYIGSVQGHLWPVTELVVKMVQYNCLMYIQPLIWVVIMAPLLWVYLLLARAQSYTVQYNFKWFVTTWLFNSFSNKSPKTAKIENKLLPVSVQIGCDMWLTNHSELYNICTEYKMHWQLCAPLQATSCHHPYYLLPHAYAHCLNIQVLTFIIVHSHLSHSPRIRSDHHPLACIMEKIFSLV
jgi:hypothetical protein